MIIILSVPKYENITLLLIQAKIVLCVYTTTNHELGHANDFPRWSLHRLTELTRDMVVLLDRFGQNNNGRNKRKRFQNNLDLSPTAFFL
jgi:hypothetical protein